MYGYLKSLRSGSKCGGLFDMGIPVERGKKSVDSGCSENRFIFYQPLILLLIMYPVEMHPQ